jgi:hypothetical protein
MGIERGVLGLRCNEELTKLYRQIAAKKAKEALEGNPLHIDTN